MAVTIYNQNWGIASSSSSSISVSVPSVTGYTLRAVYVLSACWSRVQYPSYVNVTIGGVSAYQWNTAANLIYDGWYSSFFVGGLNQSSSGTKTINYSNSETYYDSGFGGYRSIVSRIACAAYSVYATDYSYNTRTRSKVGTFSTLYDTFSSANNNLTFCIAGVNDTLSGVSSYSGTTIDHFHYNFESGDPSFVFGHKETTGSNSFGFIQGMTSNWALVSMNLDPIIPEPNSMQPPLFTLMGNI